ncbi:MAG: MMPL family transporter [Limisphaerales bacterium]
MRKLTDNNPVARALGWLARVVMRRPWLFVGSQLLLCAVCVAFILKSLASDTAFDLRQDDLVGANKKYHQNFLRFKKEFPTQADLAVVVESESTEKNRQFVERLGAKLEVETNLFHDVFYKGDLAMLGSKALLFVPEKELGELKQALVDYRPFIQQFTHTTNLVSLFGMINTQIRTAKREENAENQSLMKALPTLERIVNQARDSMHRSGTPPSPGVTALFNPTNASEQDVYITLANGRIFLLTAQAPVEELNDAAVERLRILVEQTRIEVPGVNVGLTGEPVLDHDQMAQSKKDAALASVVSLIICALLFIYAYKETGRPIKATVCLLFGLAYTLAFTFLPWPVGHLNILTITFVPILIGLAIDYGVHLISRYEEELRHGRDQEAALAKAMIFTGQGIFTGAFTTAGAFLAMVLTNFKGIQEMGLICGFGLLVCFIPMMTLLPVLLLHGRQNVIDHAQHEIELRRARIENLWLKRPLLITAIVLVLCGLAATQVHKVYFDYDLLHLQSKGLPAVEYSQKLIDANKMSDVVASVGATNLEPRAESGGQHKIQILYAAVIATNLEHAIALEEQITNLSSVASIDSITPFLAEDQTRKLAMVADIKKNLASIHFPPSSPDPVNLTELSTTLYSLLGYLGNIREEVPADQPALGKQIDSLRQAVTDLRKEMLHGDAAQLEVNSLKLAAFQRAFFDDIQTTFKGLQSQDDATPLRVQDLPQTLHDRFVGVTGKYLLMVNAKEDLWKRENQEVFIKQLRGVDPAVTGTPVQLYEYTNLLKESYVQAAEYSLVAIVFLILVHFRSFSSVLLALIPVGVGSLWLAGLMGLFHIPLNPANIMTLPLVIGIGVTNGIHILNRYAEEQTPSILTRSTGKAVLVSGLTTIAGFGSLTLGKHCGLQSLGYVMSTGLATCMIAALAFLPALLSLIPGKGVGLRQERETRHQEPVLEAVPRETGITSLNSEAKIEQ